MSYITSFERLGREQGLRQGLEEGLVQGLEKCLEKGFQKAINSIEKIMRSKGLDQKTIQEILSLSKQGLEQEEA